MPKRRAPIKPVQNLVKSDLFSAREAALPEVRIELPQASLIVAAAAAELREDLKDGFQLKDATDFIGNVARGFHSVYGGFLLNAVASLCGK